MTEGQAAESGKKRLSGRRQEAKKLTAVGWGLFFIWLGVVLLFNADVGMILIGVGAITLGMQVARKYLELESDGFWVVVGIIFILVGVWKMLDVRLPIMAVLLIVVGAALLVSALKGKTAG